MRNLCVVSIHTVENKTCNPSRSPVHCVMLVQVHLLLNYLLSITCINATTLYIFRYMLNVYIYILTNYLLLAISYILFTISLPLLYYTMFFNCYVLLAYTHVIGVWVHPISWHLLQWDIFERITHISQYIFYITFYDTNSI